ncbi:helix-turn-helix protein [Ancylobacter aquaticus]|uniref:Helix-turn-helix protein n=1 Tax=Ancylobacter aquaticus TaxID=100 RepID=A0A4R1IGX6_ANCAQ|nr:helix-turn-helix protein [Ancylobacter aquaticus]
MRATSASDQARPAACSVADGARYVGISEPTLWRMLRHGQVTRLKLRGRTLVRYADLDNLLDPQAHSSNPEGAQ